MEEGIIFLGKGRNSLKKFFFSGRTTKVMVSPPLDLRGFLQFFFICWKWSKMDDELTKNTFKFEDIIFSNTSKMIYYLFLQINIDQH